MKEQIKIMEMKVLVQNTHDQPASKTVDELQREGGGIIGILIG